MTTLWGLAWWPNDKESALQAGDTGLVPGWGTKIPHAAEQLSPSAAVTEPTGYNYRSLLTLEPAPQPRTARRDPVCHS